MSSIVEKLLVRFRIPIIVVNFVLAALMLILWHQTGSLRQGLLACALAFYAIAFLDSGVMQAVGERRLLSYKAAPRNALLLAAGLSLVSAIMVFTGSEP